MQSGNPNAPVHVHLSIVEPSDRSIPACADRKSNTPARLGNRAIRACGRHGDLPVELSLPSASVGRGDGPVGRRLGVDGHARPLRGRRQEHALLQVLGRPLSQGRRPPGEGGPHVQPRRDAAPVHAGARGRLGVPGLSGRRRWRQEPTRPLGLVPAFLQEGLRGHVRPPLQRADRAGHRHPNNAQLSVQHRHHDLRPAPLPRRAGAGDRSEAHRGGAVSGGDLRQLLPPLAPRRAQEGGRERVHDTEEGTLRAGGVPALPVRDRRIPGDRLHGADAVRVRVRGGHCVLLDGQELCYQKVVRFQVPGLPRGRQGINTLRFLVARPCAYKLWCH